MTAWNAGLHTMPSRRRQRSKKPVVVRMGFRPKPNDVPDRIQRSGGGGVHDVESTGDRRADAVRPGEAGRRRITNGTRSVQPARIADPRGVRSGGADVGITAGRTIGRLAHTDPPGTGTARAHGSARREREWWL